jgi:hypothetical protein
MRVTRSGRFTTGKETRHLLNGSQDGPYSQSERLGGQKNLLPLPWLELQNVHTAAKSQSRLRCPSSYWRQPDNTTDRLQTASCNDRSINIRERKTWNINKLILRHVMFVILRYLFCASVSPVSMQLSLVNRTYCVVFMVHNPTWLCSTPHSHFEISVQPHEAATHQNCDKANDNMKVCSVPSLSSQRFSCNSISKLL